MIQVGQNGEASIEVQTNRLVIQLFKLESISTKQEALESHSHQNLKFCGTKQTAIVKKTRMR